MSVRFISGKPGGGKTLYSVKLIVDELRKTRRGIVTNVPLNMGELCEYLQREFGEDFGARWRVYQISPEQTAEFWRHFALDANPCEKKARLRLPGGKVEERYSYEERTAGVTVWAAAEVPRWWWDELKALRRGQGVLYVIDEIHEYFNARRWKDTGDEALHYLSQHRKLGDDVICITQSIGNVDKQFRSVAQDFTYIRNHAKESLKFLGGLFRSPRMFQRQAFLEPYTGQQTGFESSWFSLDTKLAACYNTAAGVGLLGNGGADVGEKRKGLPPWMLFLPLVLVAWFLWSVPEWLAAKASQTGPAKRSWETNGPVSVFPGKSAALPQAAVVPLRAAEKAEEKVYLTGMMMWAGKVKVFLSDGRELKMGDPELKAVGKNWAQIGDKRVTFRASK